jgi:hypothetical protein
MKHQEKYIKLILENLSSINNLEEDITAGRAVVYHRTGNDATVKGVSTNGYRVGVGAYYGAGIYTCYELESQLRSEMKNSYGSILIENKVRTLDDFIIFDYDIAKKIYKSNYTLDKQLQKILGNEWSKYKNNKYLKEIIESTEKAQGGFTSNVAQAFYNSFSETIVRKCRGMIMYGRKDGKTLLAYDAKNIVPIRYSLDDGKTWKNVLTKDFYKHIKKLNPKPKDAGISHDISNLDRGVFAPADRFKKLSDYDKNRFIDIIIQKKLNSIPKEYAEYLPKESRDKYVNYILKIATLKDPNFSITASDFLNWPKDIQDKFLDGIIKLNFNSDTETYATFTGMSELSGSDFVKLDKKTRNNLNRLFTKYPNFRKVSIEQIKSMNFDQLKDIFVKKKHEFNGLETRPDLIKIIPEPLQILWVKQYNGTFGNEILNAIKSVRVKKYIADKLSEKSDRIPSSIWRYFTTEQRREYINSIVERNNTTKYPVILPAEVLSDKENKYYIDNVLEIGDKLPVNYFDKLPQNLKDYYSEKYNSKNKLKNIAEIFIKKYKK